MCCRKLSIVLGVTLAALSSAVAQPAVLDVSPRQNEINVASGSVIAVTFSEAMDATTFSGTTFRVRGRETGFYPGSLSYDAASRTATFTPVTQMKDGEIISLILTSDIRSAGGQSLTPSFQSSFTVAVEFGTGVFARPLQIPISQDPANPVERDPTALFAGDLNSDGYVDLAVVNNTTNSVSLLLNRFSSVTGSFEVQPSLPTGSGPTAIAGGDFTNNGMLDLAVANFDDNTISILNNTGAAAFASGQTISTAEHPTHIEANDYDNDGLVDIATVVLGVNRLQIYHNVGGTFRATPDSYPTGASPYGFTSGDFDNDGDLDIVVTNSGDNTIIVYKNDGLGKFASLGETAVPDFPAAVVANDLLGRTTGSYGDGFLDLVLVHPNINAVSVFDNRSRDGSFVLAQQLDVGLRPTGVFVGDVDTTEIAARSTGLGKDHDLDIAVPNIFSNDVFLWRNEFNNHFLLQSFDVYEAGETPVSIAGSDFDLDGDIDLAVTNLNSNSVSILLNQGGLAGDLRFTQPPGGIDFGQVYVGTDSTRSFTLLNPTAQTVSLDNIANSLPVFAPSVTRATVGPGQSLDFSITFAPADTVVYGDTLVIRSAIFVPSGELRIAMRGEGIRSIIEVVPDTLNFGPILPPQVAALSIEIFNRGNGALNISDLQFTNPAFSVPVSRLSVPPYSSERLDVTFRPQLAAAYLDTLLIFNSDSLKSPFPVVLLGGPNTAPPAFTSADTVFAYEDSLLTYVATVNDPDGTRPLFAFNNLPSWLAPLRPADPANDAVTGTAREGFRDTSFTVIAVDGIFSDTLQVVVIVVPVNDPPVFDRLADQTTTELTPLAFEISASDPEDSTLALSALNLPGGAFFSDRGNKSAAFSWLPPAGSRGDYFVTFVAREVYGAAPLSDTMVVKITVLAALPDLLVRSLSAPTTDITRGQTLPIIGTIGAERSAVDTPFHMTFLHDGIVARDTLVSSLAAGATLNFVYTARFNRAGNNEIIFEVDRGDQVPESDEGNNSAILLLKAKSPLLVVRPNPFTPNRDGFNDEAVFDFSKFVVSQPELRIFNFKGQLLATLSNPFGPRFSWDGRDANGREQKPGLYLYILSDNSKRLTSGYVVLAR